jgi:hypothetical protein
MDISTGMKMLKLYYLVLELFMRVTILLTQLCQICPILFIAMWFAVCGQVSSSTRSVWPFSEIFEELPWLNFAFRRWRRRLTELRWYSIRKGSITYATSWCYARSKGCKCVHSNYTRNARKHQFEFNWNRFLILGAAFGSRRWPSTRCACNGSSRSSCLEAVCMGWKTNFQNASWSLSKRSWHTHSLGVWGFVVM